jgi:hypothetical protein
MKNFLRGLRSQMDIRGFKPAGLHKFINRHIAYSCNKPEFFQLPQFGLRSERCRSGFLHRTSACDRKRGFQSPESHRASLVCLVERAETNAECSSSNPDCSGIETDREEKPGNRGGYKIDSPAGADPVTSRKATNIGRARCDTAC